ncbi:MAG: hypothetical protein A3A98_00920 [Candidatus Staskawiczbacteria bacterium RIFCSPLOWO2_01_FULL_40_39]|uniref:Uncharacterized protein n=1 Tax=Candidatus Staskawiczbacteria bacterium RIFCSPHIGHO2_01_FULL_39_25 TaxID=1802202 RepID=A0A1G2HMS6_9BACT|nr:MAG: hypothetical protein A2730_00920 [Candidatus Staskawiczbacteria bacterium RIFCSPHIGHO2_01_FULL_39_25]OGZ73292.1 MAG: hypothetical protein A3A98_00920 [Candidatus Staskawiczbacteria bacterium RIFCSPLOWO2_01_FULL_40_39]
MVQKETILAPIQKVTHNKMAIILLSAGCIAAMTIAGYFYWQLAELRKNLQNVEQQELQEVIAKVSKLIVLPEGETPTMATVTDPALLKDQPFFAKAQKGDKVLIYTNAKKAILYNPSTNKIVEVAPLNIGNNQPAAEKTTTPETK